MTNVTASKEGTPITLPPSATSQHHLTNTANNLPYLIQISRPLNWAKTLELRGPKIPVVYLLDGNAVFLTASELSWRQEFSPYYRGGGIIVAIGYPRDLDSTAPLYDGRRNADYVSYQAPDGNRTFLEFVERQVRPLIREQFPDVEITREAMFGHSFGGLCVLHALFNGWSVYDTYFACSPSIWWDDASILEEEKAFYASKHGGDEESGEKPVIRIMYGDLEQNPVQHPGESDEKHEERKKFAGEKQMGGHAQAMYRRLLDSGKFREVKITEFEGEDHGTVVTVCLLRALNGFFEG